MNKLIPVVLSIALAFTACEKEPGEGGAATIIGNVHVTQYDSDFQDIEADYPGADVDVYIIYGNNISFDDNTKTGPNGDFKFKYLYKGDYKIYVYSEADNPSGQDVVAKELEIKDRNETVNAGIFEIKKN